ncbi:MAG: ABC transporter ATP-binding protein [Phycisphaerales bacterium]
MTDAAEIDRPSPLIRLLRYGRPHRAQFVGAASCSILNKIFDLAPPILIGAAVDVVVREEASFIARLGVTDPLWQLVALAVATLVVWGFESIFEYAYGVLWRNLAQTVQHEMRIDAYSHVQGLELAYFEDRSTGGLMSILSDDINQLERFLDHGANDVLQVVTTAIVVSAVFFGVSPLIAVLAIGPVPFVLWGSFAFQRRIAPRYADVRERVANLNSQLANSLSGIATIKSFTAEEFEVDRIRRESNAYRDSNRFAIRLSSAFSPLIRMVIMVGFVATLVVGGWLTLNGEMVVGSYSVLVFLTQRLLWPFTRLGETFDLYQRAMASTERVLDLLDTPAMIESGDAALAAGSVRGDVRFDGVTFAYHHKAPVLRDLNLHAVEGRTTAIVGATGAGKSTLIKLLLRFYEGGAVGCEESGRITVDGHDIRSLRLDDLRRSIALVSQDVFLFHGTVRENIAYGRNGDVTDEAIIAAAQAAEAHEFIMELPHGYDTIVGERGQKLSGGQRQRIAMARAILKDAPILILDEATSSVDNETEAAMQRSLERISRGRTTIVIAHRLSTVRHADQIYVLVEGAVEEVGSHDELIDRDGVYAGLWKVQTGEAVEHVSPTPSA